MTTAIDAKKFPLLDLTSLREPETPIPVSTEIPALSPPSPHSEQRPAATVLIFRNRARRTRTISPRENEKRFSLLDTSSFRKSKPPTPVSKEILALLPPSPRSEQPPAAPALKDRSVEQIRQTSPLEPDYNRHFEVDSASTRASLLMVIILAAALFYQYIGLMHDRQERAIANVREKMRNPHDGCISWKYSPEVRESYCRLERKFQDELEGLQRKNS